VSRWLARSRKDLDLAANLLAGVDRDRDAAPPLTRAIPAQVNPVPRPAGSVQPTLPAHAVAAASVSRMKTDFASV